MPRGMRCMHFTTALIGGQSSLLSWLCIAGPSTVTSKYSTVSLPVLARHAVVECSECCASGARVLVSGDTKSPSRRLHNIHYRA